MFQWNKNREANPPMPSPAGELPEVTAAAEEGWVDLDFRIVRASRGPNGERFFEARGTHRGQTVALAAILGAEWDEKPLGDSGAFVYWGHGALMSVGPESDALVTILDDLYETKLGAMRMRQQVDFLAAGMGDDPRRIEEQPVQIKIFFNSDGGEKTYAEAYLNISLAEGRLGFHEKDWDYRPPLLRALAGS